MDPPYGAILFLAVLSVLTAVLSIRRARQKREKIHYIGAVIGFLMLSVFALALLNQALLAFFILVAGGIVCIATLPRIMSVQKQELERQLAKAIEETDLSEPLRLRELMGWKGWLKLAHRWGSWKTASIYSILGAVIIALVSYIALSVFYVLNIWLFAGYTISATIIIFILFHHQISKASKRNEPSKT